VRCWGTNSFGQLGDGTTTPNAEPVAVQGLDSGVSAIAVGGNHSCALLSGGTAKCWGGNYDGQLGDGTNAQRTAPVDVCAGGATAPCGSNLLTGVTSLSAGFDHTCAVASGGLTCWGKNIDGQVGDGTFTARSTPTGVIGLGSDVRAVFAGGFHTCAVTTAGGLKCWGLNTLGQVGDGTTVLRTTPADVIGLSRGVTMAEPGIVHTCAVTSAGGAKCWGANGDGQLGTGTDMGPDTCPGAPCSKVPASVSGLTSGVRAVAAGRYHACALMKAGDAKCWGKNDDGQLGDGTNESHLAPVDVQGVGDALAIGVGNFHGCVTNATAARCWGLNGSGQLGDGSVTTSNTPVDVLGLTAQEKPTPSPTAPGEGDQDGDGCTDNQEIGPNASQGGQRDPAWFWDFFDVPTGTFLVRDYVVSAADIGAVAARFGSNDATPGPFDRDSDPLSAPNAAIVPSGARANYHPAYDRGGPMAGQQPWDLQAPDGTISAGDIAAAVAQFGHSCA
jgi:alpha-tubulin suppressor-like RCC1 family protein